MGSREQFFEFVAVEILDLQAYSETTSQSEKESGAGSPIALASLRDTGRRSSIDERPLESGVSGPANHFLGQHQCEHTCAI